jgi:hypothetical protein
MTPDERHGQEDPERAANPKAVLMPTEVSSRVDIAELRAAVGLEDRESTSGNRAGSASPAVDQ